MINSFKKMFCRINVETKRIKMDDLNCKNVWCKTCCVKIKETNTSLREHMPFVWGLHFVSEIYANVSIMH